MSTAIYFHYQKGERLRDFPQILDGILDQENVFFYDALYPSKPESSFDLEPVPVQAILRVHSPEMVGRVRASGAYEGALYSAAGTLQASLNVWSGKHDNAFVFTGYGDHHAGRNSFGGGCYFNGAAIAIHELRARFGARRFAIIDTDAHHGDGTWELFEDDPDVLYLCLCPLSFEIKNNTVNITVPIRTDDKTYLHIAKDELKKWVRPFKPEIIFWNWGYDGTIGEYGDMGLSPALHGELATEIRNLAGVICNGRVVVVLCGGSSRELASFLIPEILKRMMYQ